MVLLIMAALLGGCAAMPTAHSVRRGATIDLSIGSGSAPARPAPLSRPLRTDTATPLSLWLLATHAGSALPRAGITIELDVVDARGAPTRDALVQPVRLHTDARGYAAPVTFLAARAGEFIVRAAFSDGDRIVHAYSVRVQAREPTPP